MAVLKDFRMRRQHLDVQRLWRAQRTAQAKFNFRWTIVPADGTGAANWTKRRLRYVATFSAARTSHRLVCISLSGVASAKHNGNART